jgi:protocatechuate 3,4-dioxygenase beta subunit
MATTIATTATPIELAVTRTQTEGPYWLPGSPARTNVREPGVPGEPLIFRGKVVNIRGKAIEGAWVDIWQADGEGRYDIFGYRLRGHQMTDSEGRFEHLTVVPCEYDAPLTNADGETRMVYRTAHLHVKVKAPERGTLTTQIYIPGSPGQERDSGYGDDCLLEMTDSPEGKIGEFTFVLK